MLDKKVNKNPEPIQELNHYDYTRLNTGLVKPATVVRKLTRQQLEFKSMSKEDRKAWIEDRRKKDKQLVTGRFVYHEKRGHALKFSLLRWPGDKTETYNLQDGEFYTIPLGVVDHLNRTGITYVHAYKTDVQTGPRVKMKDAIHQGKEVRRYAFVRTDFGDVAQLEQDMPALYTMSAEM